MVDIPLWENNFFYEHDFSTKTPHFHEKIEWFILSSIFNVNDDKKIFEFNINVFKFYSKILILKKMNKISR